MTLMTLTTLVATIRDVNHIRTKLQVIKNMYGAVSQKFNSIVGERQPLTEEYT